MRVRSQYSSGSDCRGCSFVCSSSRGSYGHALPAFAKLREPKTNLEPLAKAPPPMPRQMSPELRDQLRELGYIE